MRLAELAPEFLKIVDDRTYQVGVALADADGVEFLCPKCFAANGGPKGTHVIICWQPHVAPATKPGAGRWRLAGTGLDDLSLVGEPSSSVLLTSGCRAHFHVRAGRIEDLT